MDCKQHRGSNEGDADVRFLFYFIWPYWCFFNYYYLDYTYVFHSVSTCYDNDNDAEGGWITEMRAGARDAEVQVRAFFITFFRLF